MDKICKIIRKDILKMIHKAGSGHPGGSLSATEIMSVLYLGGVMKIDSKNPEWEDRDRFILSKGHVAPVLYAVLARAGFFDSKHLDTLRELGSILQGHPHKEHLPGLDSSSGSLGQGVSIAAGKALALLRKGGNQRVFCLVGDGELQEGQIWEGIMTAAHHKLSNFCLIIDDNKIQLDGNVCDIKNVYPLKEKFESFNFHTIEIDGHDCNALFKAFEEFDSVKDKPTAIIANTVKGKGVSFMEGQAGWHGLAPNDNELEKALIEIGGGDCHG